MQQQIEYIGMNDEVVVPVFGITAKRGVPVSVTKEQADALLEQTDNWKLATSKKVVA